MTVYTSAAPLAIMWPAPMEPIYQMLPARGPAPSGARRPGLTLADRWFATAVVAIPREERYGAVTWLAGAFGTSRQTIYDIAAAARARWVAEPVASMVEPPEAQSARVPRPSEVEVARGALTLLFPGGVTLRPMRVCLEELLGEGRSAPWLSAHFNAAGKRAGEVLARADWSAVAPFVGTRDEKFFDGRAYLLTVEPRSLAIVSGHVEDSVDSDRWAVSLALDQDRTGGAILGLAEDAANWYGASLSGAARLLGTPWLMPVQKDVFHVLMRARQTLRDVERSALSKLALAEKKATRDASGRWIIRDFEGYEPAHTAADTAIAQAQALHGLVGLLPDAFELVDPRSGEIRDPDTARWYLDAILDGLSAIDNRRVAGLVNYIAAQKTQLFTCLDRLEVALAPWCAAARRHFGDDALVRYFQRMAARAWRFQHAVDSGHTRLRAAAARAAHLLASLCQHDPVAHDLARELAAILDMAVRTSSASECVNSILDHYLYCRRSFGGRVSAQNFLNLFILWHGLRPFERGKRKGQSPFQIAGVRVFDPEGNPTDDWLAALGYPKAV